MKMAQPETQNPTPPQKTQNPKPETRAAGYSVGGEEEEEEVSGLAYESQVEQAAAQR